MAGSTLSGPATDHRSTSFYSSRHLSLSFPRASEASTLQLAHLKKDRLLNRPPSAAPAAAPPPRAAPDLVPPARPCLLPPHHSARGRLDAVPRPSLLRRPPPRPAAIASRGRLPFQRSPSSKSSQHKSCTSKQAPSRLASGADRPTLSPRPLLKPSTSTSQPSPVALIGRWTSSASDFNRNPSGAPRPPLLASTSARDLPQSLAWRLMPGKTGRFA